MYQKKTILLCLLLLFVVNMIGCSGGSGGGGDSTTPPPAQTPTQKLVGTWNFVSSNDGWVLGKLIFNTNESGSWGPSGFHSWRIDNGVLYFTLDSGQPEAFTLTWNNDNNITLTNHNGGASYVYARAA
ncbi:MAG: hypothetical protein AB1585_07120 [Thermodesulfobacteriota bacterium]